MRPASDAGKDLRAQLYALGQLENDELRELERARSGDDELDLAIHYWEHVLLPLTDAVEPVAPSARLWPRIAADTLDAKAKASVAADARTPRESLWERLGFWQFATFASAAAAVVLAVALLLRPPVSTAPAPAYIAVLEDPSNARAAGWLVEINADRSVRLVPLGTTQADGDRVLQFWTKAPGATGPQSLGIVPGDRATRLTAEELTSIAEGQLFEITLEPAGGSPLDRPTGPILFKGLAVSVGTNGS